MTENNSNKQTEWSDREMGALWKREGRTQTYLSGHVMVDELGVEKKVRVVVFSNKNKKKNEKAPDYRIYVSKDWEKSSSTTEETSTEESPKEEVAVAAGSDDDLL